MPTVFATIPPPPNQLLIFTPLPEAASERFADVLGGERAVAVAEAMVRGTLRTFAGADLDFAAEILWEPTPMVSGERLRQAFGDVSLAMQTGATDEERLSMAFSERFFFHRTSKIVAIGIDDPALPLALCESAFALLDSCDWVAGPSDNGAYYLVGCRGAAFDAEVFRGTDDRQSFATIMNAIRLRNRNVATLPVRPTIADPSSLAAYVHDAPAGEVANLLGQWNPP